MNTFGERLKAARNARGLTQDDLAEAVEVTKSAVSGWENNRESPGLDKLPRLRRALRQSLDALVCGPLDDPALPDLEGGRVAPPRIVDKRAEYSVSPESLRVLELFADMPEKKRKALLVILEDVPQK